MTWIRDCDGYMVNIARWDFLNIITIEDTLLESPVIYKIYLQSRDGKESVLGYLPWKYEDYEELQDRITKGCQYDFRTLKEAIQTYIYFRKEQEVEWPGQITYDEKRFKESE